MKLQRRFAPISGEFAPESVARFIGIRNLISTISLVPLQETYQTINDAVN
jgi:hypothetical protein